MGPKYRTPCVETPVEWKNAPEGPCSCRFEGLWWHVFNDPVLDELEEQAVDNNRDLMAAMDRVAQARAMAGVEKSDLYPNFSLNPSYYNSGQLFKIYLPNVANPIFTNFPTVFRIHMMQYSLPINMAYELDLWGKLRGQYASAVYFAQSEEDQFETAMLTLTTDLASSYFKLRTFDALIAVIEDNLALLRDSLALTESRFEKGLTGEQDVFAARQEVTDNEALYFDTVRQREIQINAIAILVGTTASEFCLPPMPLATDPPPICADCPSSVMLQRPDIAAAEREMASQHRLINVAYASFFPSIELTGALGFQSPDMKHFLTWKSRLWSYGVNASLPIFDGGYNMANLSLSYANFYEAAHQYQQRVLQAFGEVEDALVNVEMQGKQYESYLSSQESASARVFLSANRYKNGIANYLEVLDSERQVINARMNVVNVLGLRYLASIQLVKAVGGSWCLPDGTLDQFTTEEPRCCRKGESSDEGHRPNVIESDIERQVFKEDPFCIDEVVS